MGSPWIVQLRTYHGPKLIELDYCIQSVSLMHTPQTYKLPKNRLNHRTGFTLTGSSAVAFTQTTHFIQTVQAQT